MRERRCSLRAAGAVAAALARRRLQVLVEVQVVWRVLLRAPAVVAEARQHRRFRRA